jgi:hypothetical protein
VRAIRRHAAMAIRATTTLQAHPASVSSPSPEMRIVDSTTVLRRRYRTGVAHVIRARRRSKREAAPGGATSLEDERNQHARTGGSCG